jgi:hypothetical protein
MLSSGAGTLVPFGDSDALAEAITSYVKSPAKLHKAQIEARRIGKNLSWPAVGQQTAKILQHAAIGHGDASHSTDSLSPNDFNSRAMRGKSLDQATVR